MPWGTLHRPRLWLALTIIGSSLAYALGPNATKGPGFRVLNDWPGGARLYFALLSVAAGAHAVSFALQQLHLVPYFLWLTGGLLFIVGVSVLLAAATNHWQGIGGATLFMGLAVTHLAGLRDAWRDRSL